MTRLEWISRAIRNYDRELYAGLSSDGIPCVFRKTKAYERYELDDCVILKLSTRPFLVLALTDNWNVNGRPVDIGIERILARLNEIDLHKRDVLADLEKDYEKSEKAQERHRMNETEAFFSEHRKQFARATDGINTSQIKSDKNRRLSKWQL